MQYLLTDVEYRALGPLSETNKFREKALQLAMLVAEVTDHACPEANYRYRLGQDVPRKTRGFMDYCDDCKAKDYCPSERRDFSK